MYKLKMAGIIIGTAKTKKAAENAIKRLNNLFVCRVTIEEIK